MTAQRKLFDPAKVAAAIGTLHDPGSVFELRALGVRMDHSYRTIKSVSGFFNSADALVQELGRIASATGIYVTLNPVEPALLSRAINRINGDATTDFATRDTDILRRRWLLIDCDPARPKGISATGQELANAEEKAGEIHKFLSGRGWNEPVHALSGNGFHLLYRVDLPADDGGLLKRVLLALSQRFDDERVEVDKAVHNPSRITKLYGTLACKGDHSSERPHRMSEIVRVPAALDVVTREQLEQVAALVVETDPPRTKQNQTLVAKSAATRAVTARASTGWDAHAFVTEFVSKHGIAVARTEDKGGDVYHLLEACPWANEHGGADATGDAAIIVKPSGELGFKCFHSHCSHRHWRDLRLLYEPDYVQRKGPTLHLCDGDEVNVAKSSRPASERFYYDAVRKEYLLKNGRGVWLRLTETQFRKELASRGYRTKAGDGEHVSQADASIIAIRDQNDVVYSGQLAGHSAGFYQMGEHRMLVTTSPRIIEPRPGQFVTLEKLLAGMLDEPGFRQLDHLYGWIKVAYEALRSGTMRPGQAMAIAGPHDCGKSLLQALLTEILGGRYARPYQFMMGLTQFNSDLFEAEHLVMEDEQSSTDIRARRNFGAQIKQITVVEAQRYHAKNCPALSLKPFWRLSITLNDEAENLMVLPPLDDSLEDKIIILRARRTPMPMPTETQDQRRALWDKLISELPAFLHLITTWDIPQGIRSQRFGVSHWHHPAILAAVDALSPEARLLTIIDTAVFAVRAAAWEGTADQLEKELTDRDSAVSFEARRLFTFNTACGVYLARLSKKHPARFQHSRDSDRRRWTIEPPGTTPGCHPSNNRDGVTGCFGVFGNDNGEDEGSNDGVTGYFHIKEVDDVSITSRSAWEPTRWMGT